VVLLFHLVVWCHGKSAGSFLEVGAKERVDAGGELKLQQLQGIQNLNSLLDQGREKLAASRLVLDQPPAAAPAPSTPAASVAPAGAGAAVATTIASSPTGAASLGLPDLTQPPQLQNLVLPSYGPSTSFGPQPQIDELADIQREQMSLRQKKVMVAQQKRIIQDSEDSEVKLQQLIAVNKQIADKNDQALAAAGQHLLDRIKSYSDRLAREESGALGSGGTGMGPPAATPKAQALLDTSEEQTTNQQQTLNDATLQHQQQEQFMAFQAEMQQRMQQQSETIIRIQNILERRKRHHRHDDNDNDTDNDKDATK